MIDSVVINNFKCYKSETFEFSNLTVFCGNNSVGKSTAIQALLLIIQNNFSSSLDLEGDFIQLGTYRDVHDRNATVDSLTIEIKTNGKSLGWGYTEEVFDTTREKEVEEAPLPMLKDVFDLVAQEELRDVYREEFTFLCAERWGPRGNYPYSTKRRSKKWLGIHGEYTAQVLSTIEGMQALAEGDFRKHENGFSNTLADNLFEWMSEISPGIYIKASSLKEASVVTSNFQFDSQTYRAVNVGFGLSYVLPVVLSLLMAKPGGLVIIENPEAHLHPKGQSYLGRLAALAAKSGVQVIVETHSDHFLNGMRVIARIDPGIDPEIITLYSISKINEHSEVSKIKIKKDGKLTKWPVGFFDQQAQDMFTIMTGNTEHPSKGA